MASPQIALLTHHKCGSSWTTRVLDDIVNRSSSKILTHSWSRDFDRPIEEILRDEAPLLWVLANANASDIEHLNLKAVHLVRDPRDVWVSAYFSHLYSHPMVEAMDLRRHREALNSCPQLEGLDLELEFSAPFFEDFRSWINSPLNESILTVSYEQLRANDWLGFQTMLHYMNLITPPLDWSQARDVVRANSFDVRSGRAPGKEDAKSYIRSGAAGQWRSMLSRDQQAAFRDRYQDILEFYGYENNPDWI